MTDITLFIAVFVMATGIVLLVGVLLSGHRGRLAERMYGLAGPTSEPQAHDMVGRMAVRVMPKVAVPLVPQDKSEQQQLRVKLIQAGLYGEQAMSMFLGIKMTLILLPLVIGLAATFSGVISFWWGILFTALAALLGMIGPSIWLNARKRARQAEARRDLPDVLDMVVVCIEGGLSLMSALQKVAKELRLAHPLLATELVIVNRATELGQTMPDALRQFAARFDLTELRYLASIVSESERFGTSVGKSLRVHANSLRIERQQRAEESARKATVKLLFPTVLFIFPVIFVVVLAPSIIQLLKLFETHFGL